MDSRAQDESNDNGAEILDNIGIPQDEANQEAGEAQGNEQADPLYVQKRLKQQKRAHEREIREMQSQMQAMQANSMKSNQGNPYADGESHGAPEGVDEQIHKAVSYALGARDREERKAKEQQDVAHVHKQYQELHKHLDHVGDKYDDFDEVVRGADTPFTPHMRDAALFLDMDHKNPGSAGEVLYKLAKNPEELSRISKLHPLDQAREMVKLSKALIGNGGEGKAQNSRPLGQIKNTPVTNSQAVNDKTPVGSIRARMKDGSWK